MSNGVVWTAVLVWLLVTLDGGFAGFRDAAGRSLHLDLRPMQVRNILRGLGGAQVVCLLSAVPLLVGMAGGDTTLEEAFVRTGSMLVAFFGVYATLVLSSLSIYLLPDPDISSLSTVLVLGPLTLLRPVVIIAGWILAMPEADLWCGLACTVGCCAMLLFEKVLGLQWRDRSPLDAHLR